jgi:prephenate dehydrogenase
MALRARGWYVTGYDHDHARAERALALGALDAIGSDPDAEVTFVATPVSSVAAIARQLATPTGIVTDVGSVKGPIVAAVDHPRFVGGTPRCIRVMLHIATERSRGDLHHVYLEGAKGLNDDLPE